MFRNNSEGERISNVQIMRLCSNVFRHYDGRLVDHAVRVVFILEHLYQKLNQPEINLQLLLFCGYLHDIGAYKTDEVDRMVEFECDGILPHSIYGYLLLKHTGILKEEQAKILLYHHVANPEDPDYSYSVYSDLIFMADRVDVCMSIGKKADEILQMIRPMNFSDELYAALEEVMGETDLLEQLQGPGTAKYLADMIQELPELHAVAQDVLQMLIFTIDFTSQTTVLHSFSVIAVCDWIATKLQVGEKQKQDLCLAAMVHDIGKVAVSHDILESKGRLSAEEFGEMKSHVRYTEEILGDALPKHICQIAVRHHEKLDGSGYPCGLTAEVLDKNDCILAVADIFSALTTQRSYKNAYQCDRVIQILSSMRDAGQLDATITTLVINGYEELYAAMQEQTKHLTGAYEAIFAEYNQLVQPVEAGGVFRKIV